jgi:hypothetical protein
MGRERHGRTTADLFNDPRTVFILRARGLRPVVLSYSKSDIICAELVLAFLLSHGTYNGVPPKGASGGVEKLGKWQSWFPNRGSVHVELGRFIDTVDN